MTEKLLESSFCLAQMHGQVSSYWPMNSSDQFGACLLGIYFLVALVFVLYRVRRSGESWGPWFLFLVTQTVVVWMWRVRTNRRCPFPATGPAILIANHRSPVDPWLVCTNLHLGVTKRMFRMVSFMMAAEYYNIPGVGWICRTMDCIPVKRQGRDMAGVKECLNKLDEGKLVGIFPEGRLNTGEGLLPFGSGIAWLALKAQVPVYPVFIHNSPVGESMVAPFVTPGRASLSYGDAIDLSPYYEGHKKKEVLETVVKLLQDRLAALEYQK